MSSISDLGPSKKRPLPSSVFVVDVQDVDLNALHKLYHSKETFQGTVKRFKRINQLGDYTEDTDSPSCILTMRIIDFSNHHYGHFGFNTKVHVEIAKSMFAPTAPSPESVLFLLRPTFEVTFMYNYIYQVGFVNHIETELHYPNAVEQSEGAERNFMRSISMKLKQIIGNFIP